MKWIARVVAVVGSMLCAFARDWAGVALQVGMWAFYEANKPKPRQDRAAREIEGEPK